VSFAMFSYAFKRVVRSWKLFVALLVGVLLASAFFSGINIGVDTVAGQVLAQQLDQVPVDMDVSSGSKVISPADVASLADSVSRVEGVRGFEVVSRAYGTTQLQGDTTQTFFSFAGVSNHSRVYDGLEVVDGSQTLGVNETYVDVGSTDASRLHVGDVLPLNIVAVRRVGRGAALTVYTTVNLTVAGFVSLSDQSSSIASGAYRPLGLDVPEAFRMRLGRLQRRLQQNVLIASWEKTFSGLLDTVYSQSPSSSPVTMDILLWLDRDALVHPWDISGSLDALESVTSQVGNEAAAYGLSATNHLASVLESYQETEFSMKVQMLMLALPVFFVAWYMGLTVSDISFNLRRREIGLLLTNGLSRSQLLGLFLGEAALIGLIGGACAVGLGLLLNLFFTVVGGELGGFPVITPDTILLIVIFSIALALLSVFQPARNASKLKAVDALKEYVYVDEAKPRRRIWHWAAFILGAYKITMWILGVNLAALLPIGQRTLTTSILYGVATFIDGVLSYVGPVLFFWGFTKIFILGSVKFSETLAKTSKAFLGDLSLLPTRSIRRNAPRVASVAFLLALIMGYGVSVIGAVASEQDYASRVIYANVGADISVWLFSPTNTSTVMEEIDNLSSVSSLTPEYRFPGGTSLGNIQLRAVDPTEWPSTAYHEDGWFLGSDVQTAFQSLATDNNTIILDHAIADSLNLGVGDTIYVNFNEMICNLRIVGIFGPEPSQVVTTRRAGILGLASTRRYWSYISEGLYSQVSANVSASARILVKTVQGASGKAVAEEIYNLGPEVQRVDSVAEQLEVRQSNALLTGPVNVQRLGVVFAALAASVGVALMTIVTLRERKRELSLMGVWGFSFRHLASMLLAESLGVIIFSLLLGSLVGLVIVHGNVASSNVYTQLTMKRVVFPPDSLLVILGVVALVLGSTVIPVIVSAKRTVSKMERIV